jgi:hypothetical protein
VRLGIGAASFLILDRWAARTSFWTLHDGRYVRLRGIPNEFSARVSAPEQECSD